MPRATTRQQLSLPMVYNTNGGFAHRHQQVETTLSIETGFAAIVNVPRPQRALRSSRGTVPTHFRNRFSVFGSNGRVNSRILFGVFGQAQFFFPVELNPPSELSCFTGPWARWVSAFWFANDFVSHLV